jgi:hypothetical protein
MAHDPTPESNGASCLIGEDISHLTYRVVEYPVQVLNYADESEVVFSVDINDSSEFFVKRVEPSLNPSL